MGVSHSTGRNLTAEWGMSGNPRTFLDIQAILRTKCHVNQLKSWYETILNEYPDGYITKNQLTRIYSSSFPRGDAKIFSNETYGSFDVEIDGTVSLLELIIRLSVHCKGRMDEKLNWLFHLYDLDQSGFISTDEMVRVMRSIYKAIGVSDNTPDEHAHRILAQLDSDHDGLISLEEFMSFGKIKGSR